MHAVVALRPVVRVAVAHVHHGLQSQADDWLAFCAREAARLGLPFVCRRLDPATRPPARRPGSLSNLEAWAREGRYRALADMAAEVGARVVLTAHHAHDQLETVEMRRRRGSGVLGMAGMRERAALPYAPAGYLLLRPFLACSRDELAAWVKAQGIAWVEDPSNADLRLARNRIRQHLDHALQEDPDGLRTGLARIGLFQQAADRVLQQAAADVRAATVHVVPRHHPGSALPVGAPAVHRIGEDEAGAPDTLALSMVLDMAAPVPALDVREVLDAPEILDAPDILDVSQGPEMPYVPGGPEVSEGGGGPDAPEAVPGIGRRRVRGPGRPDRTAKPVTATPAPVRPAAWLQAPAPPAMLSRTALMRLDSTRRAEALRWWLGQLGCRMPSRQKLLEIERQLLLAGSSQAIVHHDGVGLLRYRDRIGVLPDVPAVVPTQMRWQGESFIDLPSGRLYIGPADTMGRGGPAGAATVPPDLEGPHVPKGLHHGGMLSVSAAWLRDAALLIDQGRGGERLRLHPQGSSRSWKHLMQEHGIPTCLRPCLPVIRLLDDAPDGMAPFFAAPFGLLASRGNHPYGESQSSPDSQTRAFGAQNAGQDMEITLHWQPHAALLPWL